MSHIFVSHFCFFMFHHFGLEQRGATRSSNFSTLKVCPNTVVDLLEMNNLDRAMDETKKTSVKK